MPSIEAIAQSGLGNPWLLLPTALVLGALHALEPGHSKSMMTAFIVATNGTARQAILLGIAATVGHTIVVWALALLAWRLGDAGVLERAEPWLVLIGGLLLVWLSVRILMRLRPAVAHAGHDHADHAHGHAHDVGHGQGHSHDNDHGTAHDHPHGAGHPHAGLSEDAHAAAHEAGIKKRFAGRAGVTDGEVIWFGFTGGLLPCPAAFAVLLACLHQKAYALGVVMVAAFSIGLALMLVAIGLGAAWGADALKSRVGMLDAVSRWAPVASAAIVLAIGLVTIVYGLRGTGLV